MSLFFRGRGPEQQRAISVPWGNIDTGPISHDTATAAMQLTPVYGAVSLIADAAITLPFHGYRRSGSTRVQMAADPQLITDPAAGIVDPLTWRCQYIASMLLRGNAYGFTSGATSDGVPPMMVWLHPDWVHVIAGTGVISPPQYTYLGQPLPPGSLTHIRGMTMPGDSVALSPISLFRRQIEVGQATVDWGRRWFTSGGVPSSMLTNSEKTLTQDQAQITKQRMIASLKSGEPFVVGSDWKYQQLSVSAADAQFIQTAQLTANQIASVFHVSPEDVGGVTGESQTYKTLEMNEIKFIRKAVMPWTVRLERAISDLLPKPQYAKFNLDAYVRTDILTRMQAHEIALRIGLETQDEGRVLEDSSQLTPDEITFWQENYRAGGEAAPSVQQPTKP